METLAFESAAGPWRMFTEAVEIPGVVTLWGVESHTRAFREKVLPRGTVEWMINLGSGAHHILDRSGARRSTHRTAWLSGLQNECLYIESPEPPCFVTASLHPAYAAAFTGLEAAEYTGTVVELAGAPVYQVLRGTQDWEERFAVLAEFLARRRAVANAAVVRAVDMIAQAGGAGPVQEISGMLGMSHKHLIALFTRAIGLSPKRFARLVRLEHAVAESQTATVNWTRVAQECGFHDQAHFNREFRRFTGVTPSEFLATRETSGQAMVDG